MDRAGDVALWLEQSSCRRAKGIHRPCSPQAPKPDPVRQSRVGAPKGFIGHVHPKPQSLTLFDSPGGTTDRGGGYGMFARVWPIFASNALGRFLRQPNFPEQSLRFQNVDFGNGGKGGAQQRRWPTGFFISGHAGHHRVSVRARGSASGAGPRPRARARDAVLRRARQARRRLLSSKVHKR
jgi:hypothetical protein